MDELLEAPVALDFDFKQWILEQENTPYTIEKINEKAIALTTDYGVANIEFTELAEGMVIVEFNITAKKDDSTKFYLHFQLSDEEHAKQLYSEMVETLIGLKEERTIQVLLSCSAGLTTSMFAMQLNQSAEVLGLDMHFEAVSYLSIYEEAVNYDIILIAPQIGYMLSRLKESLPNKLVLQIPTAIFASYDAAGALKFIQDEIQNLIDAKKAKMSDEEKCCICLESEVTVLTITLLADRAQRRFYYRLYEKGQITDSNMLILPAYKISKPYATHENHNVIDDIISTMKAKHSQIDYVGIGIGGIINENGQISYPHLNQDWYGLRKRFKNKHKIPTLVANNVNAAAIGYAIEHPEYHNIVFHSQPFAFAHGGQGIIANDKLLIGKRGVSGEVQFFIDRMQFSDDVNKLCWTERGTLEIVTKSILPAIVTIGPEVVVIRSPMTSDMNEIKKTMSSFIPEPFLPEFVYVKDPSGYMMDGLLKLCIDSLEEED